MFAPSCECACSYLSASERKSVVRVDTSLDRAWTNAVVGSANTGSGLEGTAVERNTHDDLARGSTVGNVPLDRSVGVDTGARSAVEVGLVVSLESDISTCESEHMFPNSRR